MNHLPLPHLRVIRPTLMPRLSKTATLAAIGALALGASATIAVTAVLEHDEQTAVISTLDGTLDGLVIRLDDVRSANTLDLNQVAEYRALILEQEASLISVDGFIQ